MKKAYILGVILIVAGILISQYPKLTDFLFRQEAKEKKEEFEKEKRNSKIKVEELYHELVKRNEALYASRRTGVRDPFLYEQNTIDLSSYGIEDGVVGFVKIDKLNVELPIYLGASEKNMSMGAAHLAETRRREYKLCDCRPSGISKDGNVPEYSKASGGRSGSN